MRWKILFGSLVFSLCVILWFYDETEKTDIIGRVVKVTDGDTITVLNSENKQVKIRLSGLDAPESKQAFGTQSRKALADKVFQKNVVVKWTKKDPYDRILGEIYIDDRLINQEMIEEGWAWHYKRYSKDDTLADAENSARRAKIGLWSDKSPMPPWDYRKHEKGKSMKLFEGFPEDMPISEIQDIMDWRENQQRFPQAINKRVVVLPCVVILVAAVIYFWTI